MPVAGWAELYVKVWDAWRAGRYDEARDVFGKALLFITQTRPFGLPGYHYVLHLRGVFPNWRGRGDQPVLDELARRSIEENLEFVSEYLTA